MGKLHRSSGSGRASFLVVDDFLDADTAMLLSQPIFRHQVQC